MTLSNLPYLLVLLGGSVYSIITISRHRRASVLALIGFLLLAINSLSFSWILPALTSSMDHEKAVMIYGWIVGIWSTVAMGLVMIAVFVERAVVVKLDPSLQDHEDFATSQLRSGRTFAEVESHLAERGLGEEQSQAVLEAAAHREVRRVGKRNLLIGIAILTMGLVITIGSYMAAAEGGVFYVTYGLIIAGLIQSIRGLAQVGD